MNPTSIRDLKAFSAGFVLSAVLALGALFVYGGRGGDAAAQERSALFGRHADAAMTLVDLADQGEAHYLEARRAEIEGTSAQAVALGADDAEVLELRTLAARQFDEAHADWRAAHADFGMGVCDYVGIVLVKGDHWPEGAQKALRYTLDRYETLREADKRLPPMPEIVPAIARDP